MTEAYLHIPPSGMNAVLRELRGLAGLGVYTIALRLQLVPSTPAHFTATKMLTDGRASVGFAGTGPRYLAPARLEHPVGFPASNHPGPVMTFANFTIDLSPSQLGALEEARDGAPFTLTLDLQGQLLRRGGAQPFFGQLTYNISAREWVRVLEELAYAHGFLIQVPRFERATSAKAADAAKRLEEALAAVHDGRYRDAVAACRDLLEAAYPDDARKHADRKPEFPQARAADKDLRFWWMRQALWLVTHAAKHADEVTVEIDWHRRDAIAVISALAALVQRDPPT